MKVGKVSPELLRRVILPYLPRRPEVLVAAGIGQDTAVLDFGPYACIATCDPITGTATHLGRLAVHVACNDVAAAGAEPLALLLTLLLPPSTQEDYLEAVMREAGETAGALGVAIAGGHTEVTAAVTQPIAVVTAIGRARSGGFVTGSGARSGEAVILTKAAGLEGTAILATDLRERLARHLSADMLDRAAGFIDEVSVLPEGTIGGRYGATAMHDVTEGGVLGAVWELAEASDIGIELWADRVPVRSETAAICKVLEIDPLALIGSGALLIAAAHPERLLEALGAAGIDAAQIGTIRSEGRVVRRNGREAPLLPPERDELWRVLDNPQQSQIG